MKVVVTYINTNEKKCYKTVLLAKTGLKIVSLRCKNFITFFLDSWVLRHWIFLYKVFNFRLKNFL